MFKGKNRRNVSMVEQKKIFYRCVACTPTGYACLYCVVLNKKWEGGGVQIRGEMKNRVEQTPMGGLLNNNIDEMASKWVTTEYQHCQNWRLAGSKSGVQYSVVYKKCITRPGRAFFFFFFFSKPKGIERRGYMYLWTTMPELGCYLRPFDAWWVFQFGFQIWGERNLGIHYGKKRIMHGRVINGKLGFNQPNLLKNLLKESQWEKPKRSPQTMWALHGIILKTKKKAGEKTMRWAEGGGSELKSMTEVIGWAFGVEVSRVLSHVGVIDHNSMRLKKSRFAWRGCSMTVWFVWVRNGFILKISAVLCFGKEKKKGGVHWDRFVYIYQTGAHS